MKKYYAAIDIGGSSGRVMLYSLTDGRMTGEEVHRFENGQHEEGKFLVWDVEYLFSEILAGLKKCREIGKIPASVGVDMWGVDYVVIGKDGRLTSPAVTQRDSRTQGIDECLSKRISEERMYGIAGIQKMMLNTVYQLTAVTEKNPEWLDGAEAVLLLPDYMTYRLTGRIAAEYTNASTTGMLDAGTRDWSDEIVNAVGIERNLLPDIVMPGERAGGLLPAVRDFVGYDADVYYVVSHDTGSAVVSVSESDVIYISSGTWSLVGVEKDEPSLDALSRARNFTNEGGYGGKIRFLKNIVGMWFIQSIRRETGKKYSYPEMSAMARAVGKPRHLIDVFDPRFLSPRSMIGEIRAATGDSELPLDEILASVYHSLAMAYRDVFLTIDELTGKYNKRVCIIGGGSRDEFLNALTAEYSGREVTCGVVEATATGNATVQMIAAGDIKDLAAAREIIKKSDL